MLDPSKFREGTILGSTGSVEIRLPDDDVDAMTIFLNIIHLHMHQVPEKVDHNTLFKLAFLVDKYDCHEAVKPFSRAWITNFPRISTIPCAEFMGVSWAFQRPSQFRTVTQLAIKTSSTELEPVLPLPVPAAYFGMSTTCLLQNIN
jgi:hypothetical protein